MAKKAYEEGDTTETQEQEKIRIQKAQEQYHQELDEAKQLCEDRVRAALESSDQENKNVMEEIERFLNEYVPALLELAERRQNAKYRFEQQTDPVQYANYLKRVERDKTLGSDLFQSYRSGAYKLDSLLKIYAD